MKKKQKTIYAFIDSQNLNLAIRDQGWRLDFKKFRIYLTEKYNASKAFLFIGYIKKYEKLYNYLRKCRFILVFKRVLKSKNNDVKGNVDAELVLHSMIEFPNYNKAVIVTGDGDFYCLIEYLEQKGKLLGLVVPHKFKYSALLRKFYRYILFLGDQKNKVQQKKSHLFKD